mgnify:CR=1 FL=1
MDYAKFFVYLFFSKYKPAVKSLRVSSLKGTLMLQLVDCPNEKIQCSTHTLQLGCYVLDSVTELYGQ